MIAMPNSPGRGTRHGTWAGLAEVVVAGWLLLGLAAFLYARIKGIAEWAALPVAAAFLIEFPFYLLPAFEGPRAWLGKQGRIGGACLLSASAIAPWLVYSLSTSEARFGPFLLLLAVAVAVSFWYVALPAKAVSDALFLIAIAAVYLSKIFDQIYLSPIPKLSISILGHLMLIRTAAIAILIFRRNVHAEFRFLPNRREWLTGLRYFGMMLPVIALAYWALGLVKVRLHPNGIGLTLLLAIGTFFGVLWVVALSEEFFFRGLLQQWLERWTDSPAVALIVASLVFGCAHLGFHRIFPNWRWAIVAAILGLFCGLAWRKSRSVQAPMVAHALIVTIWQVFFQ
jgi:membrane protease YdiL (CAAX protease family)